MIRIEYQYEHGVTRSRWVEETDNSSSRCGELIMKDDEFYNLRRILEGYPDSFKFIQKGTK